MKWKCHYQISNNLIIIISTCCYNKTRPKENENEEEFRKLHWALWHQCNISDNLIIVFTFQTPNARVCECVRLFVISLVNHCHCVLHFGNTFIAADSNVVCFRIFNALNLNKILKFEIHSSQNFPKDTKRFVFDWLLDRTGADKQFMSNWHYAGAHYHSHQSACDISFRFYDFGNAAMSELKSEIKSCSILNRKWTVSGWAAAIHSSSCDWQIVWHCRCATVHKLMTK